MNDTHPAPSPRKSYTNLPMTLTAFTKQVAALRKALRDLYGSSFHHAELGIRASPDDRPDAHNVLREDLDPEYHAECDVYDTVPLDELRFQSMHGPVVLDLYVYEKTEWGGPDGYQLFSNAGAFFRNGKFIGVVDSVPAGADYERLLAEVQKAG